MASCILHSSHIQLGSYLYGLLKALQLLVCTSDWFIVAHLTHSPAFLSHLEVWKEHHIQVIYLPIRVRRFISRVRARLRARVRVRIRRVIELRLGLGFGVWVRSDESADANRRIT